MPQRVANRVRQEHQKPPVACAYSPQQTPTTTSNDNLDADELLAGANVTLLPTASYRRTAYRGIARFDHGVKGLHGYWVRTSWKGTQYARFFSDKKADGDRLVALADAVTWRDETEREIGKQDKRGRVRAKPPRPSNTGRTGVTETLHGGRPVFQVTWFAYGKLHRTTVSIRKYGRKQALVRATAIYREHQHEGS